MGARAKIKTRLFLGQTRPGPEASVAEEVEAVIAAWAMRRRPGAFERMAQRLTSR